MSTLGYLKQVICEVTLHFGSSTTRVLKSEGTLNNRVEQATAGTNIIRRGSSSPVHLPSCLPHARLWPGVLPLHSSSPCPYLSLWVSPSQRWSLLRPQQSALHPWLWAGSAQSF